MGSKDDKKGKKKKGRGGGAPLSGLAAALVQAGALSEGRAQALSRDKKREDRKQREERKSVGRKGMKERDRRSDAEKAAHREVQAAADRAREVAKTSEQAIESAKKTIREHRVREGGRGPRRWFFVTRDGVIPYLNISDGLAQKLERGEAAIVESLGEARDPHVVVAGAGPLGTLHGLDPELIRFWNRPRGAGGR